MKKRTILLAASLAVTASISLGATFAWLQSETNTLTNTFTVGQIGLTLDEAKVERNTVVEDADRVKDGNTYVLYEGAVLPKDPTVTVTAESENCYVFMYCDVSEDLTAITEINYDTSKWLSVGDNIYVYSENGTEATIVPYSETDTVLSPLFTTVTVTGDCPEDMAEETQIVIKALAYQSNDSSTYSDALAAANKLWL